MSQYQKTIYIFTRDLRLDDNIALINALKKSVYVIPVFIFNPKQIGSSNKYKSDKCIQFMCESLDELNNELRHKNTKLFMFHDNPENVVKNMIHDDIEIECVIMSSDYTPFAIERENKIKEICEKNNISFEKYENHMLTGADQVLKKDGTMYQKFTPYYRNAILINVNNIIKNLHGNYITNKYRIQHEYKGDIHKFYKFDEKTLVQGGRNKALQIIKKIKNFDNYDKTRDYPSENTTLLSAYLKFGCVSVREVYRKFKKYLTSTNKLFVQLYWRDFYMALIYHYPQHLLYKNQEELYSIRWQNRTDYFNYWCLGNTGIPIIDAGMRQLNTTGWMHNRVRMIVANFLIKILHIDWRWGEQYFAQKLVDYDVFNNNGGWGWSSSFIADSQPYFRVFNPWRQTEKYDKNCEYIKTWIPELRQVPEKDILKWDIMHKNYNINYPKPIIMDIKKEARKTIQLYKQKK